MGARYVAPTIVAAPALDSPLMQSEIFGPILYANTDLICHCDFVCLRIVAACGVFGYLTFCGSCTHSPVLSVQSPGEAVRFIAARPHPLALYVFSESHDHVNLVCFCLFRAILVIIAD